MAVGRGHAPGLNYAPVLPINGQSETCFHEREATRRMCDQSGTEHSRVDQPEEAGCWYYGSRQSRRRRCRTTGLTCFRLTPTAQSHQQTDCRQRTEQSSGRRHNLIAFMKSVFARQHASAPSSQFALHSTPSVIREPVNP
ncbi:uncharacterized protein LOC108098645 [Drosophila ficusphila]|uniref:uncharacterized protein LOC108098645 n=1 Tax=Drosophila ficusphila TaxID=30025 RepID=UPI0007E76950|nr:uncharacterized protein LOC108098645 [Drosophila ficusphila]